ncbi:MAG: NTP transferase domain-containing protein [Bacteroidetes bacterium]|nr:NTP transferase domain-containing protein [Bacteroidota bacterium]
MNAQKHKKHEEIARPGLGTFGRNEWAILGTNCGDIKKLTAQLCEAFAPKWKIAYVDADHQSAVGSPKLAVGSPKSEITPPKSFVAMEYADKIGFHRLDFSGKLDSYQYRPLFSGMDVVLVNGNHFTAKKQVVVIDPKKEDSLRRKLDRLTDVQLILLTDGVDGPFGFLKENLKDFNKIPVVQLADFQKIKPFFEKWLEAAVPPLNGLVLAGGKSRRMGTDKSVLQYHDKPQRDVMLDLLDKFCQKTHLSCRPDQAGELFYTHDVLPDTFLGLGPMGAILSAFRQQPDSAWLVVACDLPLLDEATLRFLVENRNPSAMATSFRSPENEFPEPLVAIWEPKSYPVLLQFLAQGYSCPRKVLINSPVHLLDAPNSDALTNVNTPDEVDVVLKKLGVTDL